MAFATTIMVMATGRQVLVTFVMAATSHEITRTTLPLDSLIGDVTAGNTVYLGDTGYRIEATDPAEVARAGDTGRLTITVSRLDVVAPAGVKYSLPTICDELPPQGPRQDSPPYRMHEDNWRQREFVAAHLLDLIEAELRSVRRIHAEHSVRDAQGNAFCFDAMHIRTQPVRPLPEPIALAQVRELLPAPDRVYGGAGFDQATGSVTDSFAQSFGPLTCYGIARDGQAGVLGVDLRRGSTARLPELAEALPRVLRAFDLVLVDWPGCVVVTPDSAAGYLTGLLSVPE